MITSLVFVAALAQPGLIQPMCGWNHPGADPTTSSVPATLHAMGIDSPELAAKIEAGDYSEMVTVHRLDDRTRGMSSGQAHWCAGEVDRHEWTDDQAEQGRVYRVPGQPAVVWYWRCKNMSMWLPPEATGMALLPAEVFELPPEPTSAGLPVPALAGPAGPIENPATDRALGFPPAMPVVVGGSIGLPCDCALILLPVAAIPEPNDAVLLVPGLLTLWLRGRGRPGRPRRRASR